MLASLRTGDGGSSLVLKFNAQVGMIKASIKSYTHHEDLQRYTRKHLCFVA